MIPMNKISLLFFIKKKILIILVLLISLNLLNLFVIKNVFAQSSSWIKTIDTPTLGYNPPKYDSIYSVATTSDGGYIMAGFRSENSLNSDIIVIKMDSFGDIKWAKTIDVGVNNWSFSDSIHQTSDGGYIIAGNTSDSVTGDTSSDILVIKLSSSGNINWIKRFSRKAPNQDLVHSIQKTSDGGYIMVAINKFALDEPALLVIKLNSAGNISWAKTVNIKVIENNAFIKFSVQQTSDNGYIIVGNAWNFGSSTDVFIIKLSSSGDFRWAKTVDLGGDDNANSIQKTSDGGYVIVGTIDNFYEENLMQIFIMKLDSQGNISWTKKINGGRGTLLYGLSVQQTFDRGYIVAGDIADARTGSNYDVLAIKLDSAGNISWAKKIVKQFEDLAFSVKQTLDGGYIIVGFTLDTANAFVVKLNSSGDVPGCSLISSLSSLTISPASPTVYNVYPAVASESMAVTNVAPVVFSSIIPSVSNECVSLASYVNCGFRVRTTRENLAIACEPPGTVTSPLRIRKGNNTYGIVLVDLTDPNASPVRIKTSSGIKALRKY
jgi:hypothetical protein